MAEKHVYLKNLQPGDTLVDGVYQLKKLEMDPKTNIYVGLVSDATGSCQLKINVGNFKQEYYKFVGKAVKCSKLFVLYEGRAVLKLSGELSLAENGDVSSGVLNTSLSEETKASLAADLNQMVKSVKRPELREILGNSLGESVVCRMAALPESLRKPLDFSGGMLHQAVTVTKMAVAMAGICQMAETDPLMGAVEYDTDVIICAGLLHNIGTIREFTSEFPYSRTDSGIFSSKYELSYHCVANLLTKLGDEVTKNKILCCIRQMYNMDKKPPIKEASVLAKCLEVYRLTVMQAVAQTELLTQEETPSSMFEYSASYGAYIECCSKKEE